MRTLRGTTTALALTVMLVPGAPPADAATAATFEGTAEIGCWGCGTYGPAGNSADFTVTGVFDDTPMVANRGSASFTVKTPTGVGCVVSGQATGSLSIAGDRVRTRSFVWSRVGSFAVITIATPGRPGITGWAKLVLSSDSVPPCGARARIRYYGALA